MSTPVLPGWTYARVAGLSADKFYEHASMMSFSACPFNNTGETLLTGTWLTLS